MKVENKENYQKSKQIESQIGTYGDTMSFSEIADRLDMTELQVKRTYEKALQKLQSPSFARLLWEYNKIGDKPHISDMGGTNH